MFTFSGEELDAQEFDGIDTNKDSFYDNYEEKNKLYGNNNKPQIVPEKTTIGEGPIEIITEAEFIEPIQTTTFEPIKITTFRPIIGIKTTQEPIIEQGPDSENQNPVRSELGQNSQAGIYFE